MMTRPISLVFGIAIVWILGAQAALGRSTDGGHRERLGPLFDTSQNAQSVRVPRPTGALLRWNAIAIDASGLDHAPVAEGEDRVFGEQLGPGRASRAMAIVHIAMFDAANAVAGGYRSYTGIERAPIGASFDAAVSQAAHDALAAMYPSQVAQFSEELAASLDRIRDRAARRRGIAVGRVAAAAVLAQRADDGAAHAEPRVGIEHITSDQPGHWRQDPISQIPLALGAYWNTVEPFVIETADQFRVPPPPALDSAEYARAFHEVQAFGGEDDATSERTEDQKFTGIYWAYDGTPSLCAPPRLYNQIAVQIARQKRTTGVDLARLLALVNVAMADSGIAIWESKFHYDFWRPITGIREADPGTGPTGLGDGNPDTQGDPAFSPLGAPASNLQGPNFTPPFPAYPSGHAGFGGALFQTLRRFYRTDAISFTFVSDELNGVTVDNAGDTRPLMPRHFETLSEAEEENGQSRIYLGIHWAFDKTAGIAQGRNVANYVFDHAFRPQRRR